MRRLLMAGGLLALWDLWRFFRRGRAHWAYRGRSRPARSDGADDTGSGAGGR